MSPPHQADAEVISLCARRRVREEMRAIRHEIGESFVVEGVRFEVEVTNLTGTIAAQPGSPASCEGNA